MNTDTQCKLVLRHLAKGHSLTQPEASRLYHVGRLAARAWDLRTGHNPTRVKWPVEKTMVKTRSGSRIASYFIPAAKRARS